MRVLKMVLVVVVMAGISAGVMGAASEAGKEGKKKHVVSAEKGDVVILMDSKGGMLRRVSEDPQLKVLADGTVLVGDPFGLGRAAEGKLSLEELQGLLRFVLDEEKFGTITPGDLKMKQLMAI